MVGQQRLRHSAARLVTMGIIANFVGGLLGLLLGVLYHSAILGVFGLSSLIAMMASAPYLHHLVGLQEEEALHFDDFATVLSFTSSVCFLLLAIGTGISSPHMFREHQSSLSFPIGPLYAGAMACLGPALTILKHRIGQHLRDRSFRRHVQDSIVRSWLSGLLAIGVLGNEAGWYELDAAMAATMSPLLLWQSYSAFRSIR